MCSKDKSHDMTTFPRQNNSPLEDVQILVSGNFEYATEHCKRDFENVIKVITLRWEFMDYLGNLITWVLKTWKDKKQDLIHL